MLEKNEKSVLEIGARGNEIIATKNNMNKSVLEKKIGAKAHLIGFSKKKSLLEKIGAENRCYYHIKSLLEIIKSVLAESVRSGFKISDSVQKIGAENRF